MLPAFTSDTFWFITIVSQARVSASLVTIRIRAAHVDHKANTESIFFVAGMLSDPAH